MRYSWKVSNFLQCKGMLTFAYLLSFIDSGDPELAEEDDEANKKAIEE